jgi:hypothetical protein
MSDLKSIEKLKLEKLFQMGGGYVLNFSDRTFQEFVLENTGLDAYDTKYTYRTGSKANRLRAIWDKESNYTVSKLIFDFFEYWKELKRTHKTPIEENEKLLFDECYKIAERLKSETLGEHIEAIQPNTDEKSFHRLATSIREDIENNKPDEALDRLHTFVVKYIRELCDKHGVICDKNKPLHSFFGEYVKNLKSKNLIEAAMTERILKSSISILESFNDVRNNKSYAHDNQLLNYNESLFIFRNISSIIEFLQHIESSNGTPNINEKTGIDLPF